MSIWSGIAAAGVAIALAFAAVANPIWEWREFQQDLDAPRRMGPGHRRRLGLRMGVVGPLASRARAEVGSQENGSDDQTDSNDDHGSPASAGGARPIDAGT